jgi:hypothetical protein
LITAADSEFHDRDPAVSNWAETQVLIFSVPEAGILANAYVLARPNIGVCASSIIVFQGFRAQPYEIDFVDARMHLPCPASFLDMSLDNGFTLKATNPPRDFSYSYRDTHGACSFDLDFRALHQPFDTHDPSENGLLARGGDDMGYGDAWATGHLDTIGHITGELELRGTRYTVDCYEGMDRSWGPREEWGGRAVSWLHIPFGDEFGVHLAMAMSLRDGRIVYDQLRFGYLHEHGEVVGIVEASMEAERVNMIPTTNRVRIKDARGREFEFHGAAVAGSPYYQFIPAYVCFHTLMRYTDGTRVAYSEQGDIFGMDWLGDRFSPHARVGSTTASIGR